MIAHLGCTRVDGPTAHQGMCSSPLLGMKADAEPKLCHRDEWSVQQPLFDDTNCRSNRVRCSELHISHCNLPQRMTRSSLPCKLTVPLNDNERHKTDRTLRIAFFCSFALVLSHLIRHGRPILEVPDLNARGGVAKHPAPSPTLSLARSRSQGRVQFSSSFPEVMQKL